MPKKKKTIRSRPEATWTTSNGVVLPLSRMTDDHLLNAQRMVARAISRGQEATKKAPSLRKELRRRGLI